jgi:hypothetical protein
VVTRRALLAGGTVLLAGCGKDLPASPPLPSSEEVLGRQLEAESALHAELDALDAPAADRALVRRLVLRSEDRAARIAAALGLTALGVEGEREPADPEVVAELGRAALAAHVEALPSLTERRLGTDLVVESATDLALLGAVFQLVTVETFPGAST